MATPLPEYFAPASDFALGLMVDPPPSSFPPMGPPITASSLMNLPIDDPSLLGPPPMLPPGPAWSLGVVDANPHQPPLPSGLKRKRSPGTVSGLASPQSWLNTSWMPAVHAPWPGPWSSPAPGPSPSPLRDGLEAEMPMPLPIPSSLPMPPEHEAQPSAWLPAESPILTCQSCSTSWQRQALPPHPPHPPAAAASRASPAPLAFICRACQLSRGEDGPSSAHAAAPDRRLVVERLRRRRLAALSPAVTPAKPELVGFVESQASDAERTNYFLRRTPTDLLSLLSFCDQLNPGLLAALLASVSQQHPDLPLFHDPDWRLGDDQSPGQSPPAKQQPAGPAVRTAPKNKGRSRFRKPPPAQNPPSAGPSVPEKPTRPVNKDLPPPTWPRPGEGFYSKLAPETEDRLLLQGKDDQEVLSHFMVDRVGKPTAISGYA